MNSFLFSNFEEHPTNDKFLVFRFLMKPMAEEFASTLTDRKIPFESFTEGEDQIQYFFAVKKSHQDEAKRINYLVFAKHRKPLIQNKFARLALVGTVLALILLSLIGYIKANG